MNDVAAITAAAVSRQQIGDDFAAFGDIFDLEFAGGVFILGIDDDQSGVFHGCCGWRGAEQLAEGLRLGGHDGFGFVNVNVNVLNEGEIELILLNEQMEALYSYLPSV